MHQSSLSGSQTLVRFALIGALLLTFVALFAYTGGWLSPERLTQGRMLAGLHGASGDHPGFRAAHAKGMCFSGSFDSSGAAAQYSKATVFAAGKVAVIGRFATSGGMPFEADGPTVRSLALRFMPVDAAEWRTGMNNIPVFIVNTPQAFYEELVAAKLDLATGKPDPEAMKAFLDRHPEAVRAFAVIKAQAAPAGFADSTFNSLNAFRFVNAAGAKVAVRWAAVPMQQAVLQANSADDDAIHTSAKNRSFDDLIVQSHEQPLRWRLIVTLAAPGDVTADATLKWPEERPHIDAGTVTVEKLSSEDDGPCTDINFDPLVLPAGIEASDDLLLSARSAVYARSFTQRAAARAAKPPSAISPSEIQTVVKP